MFNFGTWRSFAVLSFALTGPAVPPASAQFAPASPVPVFQHRHWTVAHGLPVNHVTGWHQSQDGYIWLSTFDGFVRFDGLRFVQMPPARGSGLHGVRIAAILGEAGEGIWLGGLPSQLIEYRAGELHLRAGPLGTHTPSAVLEISDSDRPEGEAGVVWLGTDAGLFRRVGDQLVHTFAGFIDEPVKSLAEGRGGELWVGTSSRLLSISDGGAGVIQTHEWPVGDPVLRLLHDPEGVLWALGLRTVLEIRGDGVREYPSLPWDVIPTRIRRVAPGGELLLQSRNGTLLFSEGRWAAIQPERAEALPSAWGFPGPDDTRWILGRDFVSANGTIVLRGEGFQGLEFDRVGNAWVWGIDGLHRLTPGFLRQWGRDAGYPDNTYALNEGADGRIWMTFLDDGVGKLARIDEEGVRIFGPPAFSPFEMAVLEDRTGRVWVAQKAGGVCVLREGRCVEVSDFGRSLVRGIFESSTGELWFGTTAGVYRLRPDGSWRHFEVGDGLAHPFVRSFAEDAEGRIWMGTFGGGVSVWDGTGFETIGPREGLSGGGVRSLRVDRSGTLWVGTEGEGLNRVTGRRGPDGRTAWSIKVLTKDDGLFDNGIHEILEDPYGRIWMSSNRGVFWVPLEDLEAFAKGEIRTVRSISYDEDHGLLNRELNGSVHASGIRTRSGLLLFAGIAGTVVINPESVVVDGHEPSLHFEGVRAGRDSWGVGMGSLTLPSGLRTFEVDYTAVGTRKSENLRFRYRLEGFDRDWIDAGVRRTAFYTNVPPGTYTLRIAVWQEGGSWIEGEEGLQISVPPTVLERKSVHAGLGILMVLLLVGGIVRRERSVTRRRNELERLVRARTRVAEEQALRLKELDEQKNLHFQDLSHELRDPLTLILGSAETIRGSGELAQLPPATSGHLDEVVTNARRLRSLVDQILDLARLERGQLALKPRAVDPNELLEYVALTFAPAAERARLRLGIRPLAGAPRVPLDPDQMWTVLSNLVSNAIKFSKPGGTVEIGVEMGSDHSLGAEAGQISFYVRDQGIGIPVDEQALIFDRFRRGRRADVRTVPGAGIGLALAKQIVELHQGEIRVVSEEGAGSVFRVILPLAPEGVPLIDSGSALEVWTPSAPTSPPSIRPSRPSERLNQPPWESSLRPGPLEEASAPSHAPRAGPRGETILVADDHAQVRRLIRELLQGQFDVREAGSTDEAIEAIRKEKPSAVISDVRMPGGGAEALLTTLRASRDFRHIPVLLLSANATQEDRIQGFKWGADDYLTKPFEPFELMARIEALIESQKRRADGPRTTIHLHPGTPQVETEDVRFFARLRDVIEENLSDPDFGVEALARKTGHSRSALYRKLGSFGSGSAADLIRQMRLARAKQLLESEAGSVHRVARLCGFTSPSHFSRLFRDEYGYPPSQFPAPPDAQR